MEEIWLYGLHDGHQDFESLLRDRAEIRVKIKESLKIHAMFFCIGNLLLLLINISILYTNKDFDLIWFSIPLLGWFIGLSIHITTYIFYIREVSFLNKKILIYHFIIYTDVLLMLLTINIVVTPYLSWIIYPAIFWGIGLFGHSLIYYSFLKVIKINGKLFSKKEYEILKELKKLG